MEESKHCLMKFHLWFRAEYLNAVHFSAVNGWHTKDESLAVCYSRESLKDVDKKKGC